MNFRHYFTYFIQRSVATAGYLSVRKAKNYAGLLWSYLLSVTSIKETQNLKPCFISVEPANYCQLYCPECPVGKNQRKNNERLTMDEQLYKLLIDELKSTLIQVIFYFQGEPTLNKNLPFMINYAHASGIYTSTSTNGQSISEEYAEKIVHSGLDKLIVSVDGSTQETYESYRIGGNLEKALESIRKIAACKKKLHSPTPLIEIQCLVLKTNEHQMKEMKQLLKETEADRLTFKSAQLYDFEDGNKLLTTKKRYARYKKGKDGKYKLKGRQPNRCWRMWSGSVVNVNGEVLPCCFDKNSDYSFGNIRENGFANCWHSNKAESFRASILNNRKQHDMCRNCTY